MLKRASVRGSFTFNVASTLFLQSISLLVVILTGAITARWLGPEGKGLLGLAVLIPGLLSLLLSGGLATANIYFAGSQRLGVSALTVNSIGFAAVGTICGICIVGILIVVGLLQSLVPGVPTWLIVLGMFGLPIWMLGSFFSGILQGLHHLLAVNLISLAQDILTLVLTILLVIVLPIGVSGALLASIGSAAIGLLVMGVLLYRVGGERTRPWDSTVIHSTLSFGLRGYVGNLLQFFNYRLDTFLVNYFLGAADVGIYGVSVRLGELLWYLPNAVGFVIFPKAAATRPEEMNTFTPTVFRITLVVTMLGALCLALVGAPLIQFIYSSAFMGAYLPLLALLPGIVTLGGAKVLTNEIAGRGYPQYNSVNTAIALVATVVLDLVLIPRNGVLGAAIASSIAYTMIFVIAIGFYFVVSRRTIHQPYSERG